MMNDTGGRRTLGEYIRKKRLEADLTQKELAGRLFVAESTVSKWERGLSYPDVSMVPGVCRELGISEREFFAACGAGRERPQTRDVRPRRGTARGLRLFFAGSYAVAAAACFICDLAVFRTLDWFWIVLTALMLAFSFTNLPALVRRNRLPVCLGAATGSLLLLLLSCWTYTGEWWVLGGGAVTAVCLALFWSWWAIWRFYGRHVAALCMAAFSVWVFLLLAVIQAFAGGDWLLGFACPIAAFGVGYVWLYFAVLCWLSVGPWLKAGICSLLTAFAVPLVNALCAALLSHQSALPLAGYFAWGRILTRTDADGQSWVNVLIFAVLLLASLGLTAAGIVMEARRRASPPEGAGPF